MALFEVMRENTKVILWITVIAFVGLIFLAWGADFSSRLGLRGGGVEAGVIARVNGERITMQEYGQAWEQTRIMFQQSGRPFDEETEMMMQQTVWDQLIERSLLAQEAKKRGIVVTEAEVAEALMQNPSQTVMMNPAFQNQGRFDIRLYQNWLTDPRTNTLPLEREQREMLAQAKLQLLLLAGVTVTEAEVRHAWLEQNERVDLAFAEVPYPEMQAPAAPDDSELQRYLDAHAEEFKLPERASLEYVRIPKGISPDDSSDARRQIEEAQQELAAGEDFSVIVQIYSEAPPSRRGGESGTFMTRDQFSGPELRDAAFSLEIGKPSPILTSPEGYHILRVEERKTENGNELAKVADILVPIKTSFDTNAALRDRAAELADSASAEGFASLAQGYGYTVAETGFFDVGGFVPGLQQVQPTEEFAKSAHPGAVSKPIQVRDAWYVLRLVDKQPARAATLADVRARVQAAWMNEQRKQAAAALAERILERRRAGTPLDNAIAGERPASFSTSQGATRKGYVRGIGQEPRVTGAAFSLESVGLVPFVEQGNQAAFVVEVTGRTPADETAYAGARDELRTRLLRTKQNQAIGEWMRKQREEARIDDFRDVLVSL